MNPDGWSKKERPQGSGTKGGDLEGIQEGHPGKGVLVGICHATGSIRQSPRSYTGSC